MGIVLTILFIASIVVNIILLCFKRYSNLLIGTIVGKYKGDKFKYSGGGYVLVEIEIEYYTPDSRYKQTRKEQKTYEVPEEYYTQKNIGDKGLFPC